LGSLKEWFQKYPSDIAAVIMEPMSIDWPNQGFLQSVKEITHQYGAILIFDETITGCRFSIGGAQELFGVIPDLATFGKGLANGMPLSAVLGRRDIMLKMEDIFFSGTFGGETLSLAAAKVVLKKIKNDNIVERLSRIGQLIIDGVSELIIHCPIRDSLSTILSFFIFFNTTLAAAKESVSPPNVPEKKISSILSIISLLPSTADNGIPLAKPFPNVAKSGITPNNSCAPPIENLQPVIVSSKISMAPY
jgi:glutamate-1-semialdehyde aminotransferase